MENKHARILFGIVIGIMIVVAGYLAFYRWKSSEPMVQTNMVLLGTFTCLPHIDTSGPQTEECAFGFKTDEGEYYAVNFGAKASSMELFQKRAHVRAEGFLQTDSEHMTQWKRYPVRGLFTITDMVEVSDAPIAAPIVLRPDGLGVVSFGASPEEAITALTSTLGAPTKDTGWVDSFSTYGTCPGEKIRGVEWNSLHVLFGDTLHGKNAFFGFEYVNRNGSAAPSLSTEKKITLGATKEAIKAAYPSATFGEWLPGQTGTTFVRGAEGSGEYLGGTIEDNKLFWIGGGIFCGE